MSFLSSLLGSSKKSVKTDIHTTIDMTTHAASLASNPSDIDLLLDKVRGITSRLQPGQTLSDVDNQSLIDIYLKLEAYLTTKEPLRTFTRDELRARLSPELRQQLVDYETNNKGRV